MTVARPADAATINRVLRQEYHLAPNHAQYLLERAISPDSAQRAGLLSVDAHTGGCLLGLGRPLSSGGLLIPYFNTDDYARIRLDGCNSRSMARNGDRFMVRKDREVPIYIPPGYAFEGTAPIHIVEGPIKALALQQYGLGTIGLGGTDTTLTRNDRKLNSSWGSVAVCQREVIIIFDSNRADNPKVARAEARLALALEQSGAKVRVAALPMREDGQHQGPDDYLFKHAEAALRRVIGAAVPADPVQRAHDIAGEQAVELLDDLPFLLSLRERGVAAQKKVALLLRTHGIKESDVRQAMKEAQCKAKELKSEAMVVERFWYTTLEGSLCLVTRPDGATEHVRPMCNFSAQIVEDETLDDGAEKKRVFVVEGELASGSSLPRVRVTPEEFETELWPSKQWGARASVYANIPRAAGHLRAAIKACSTPREKVTFLHTGFREHGDDWIYLHAGGAVGAPEVSVELETPFRRYKLPDFAKDAAEAVEASLEFLTVADKRITLPLHSAVYRAPLQEAYYTDTTLCLYGKTGSMKSTIAALAQSHWGDFDHVMLPLSWAGTANAIELHLHRMKDALVTIDDFAPKSADPNDELHKKAAYVFRNIGNGGGRSRLRSDCTARPDRPCRALVVSTGEDLPRGESVQARLVTIRVMRENIDLDTLTRLQGDHHRLPHAMVSYIHWLRPRMAQLKVEVEKKFREFRKDLQQQCGHLRAPAAMSHLLVGAFYFTEFAKDIGVMSDEDAEHHLNEVKAVLLENYFEQVRATEQSNPGRRFFDVMRSLLLRKKVLLRERGQPLSGTLEEGVAYIGSPPEPIGWQDEAYAYILPDVAFEVVSRALKAMNEGTPLHQHGLWARMMEEGLILPDGKKSTHQISVHGKRVRVLMVDRTLLDEEPDPDGPEGGPGDMTTGDRETREVNGETALASTSPSFRTSTGPLTSSTHLLTSSSPPGEEGASAVTARNQPFFPADPRPTHLPHLFQGEGLAQADGAPTACPLRVAPYLEGSLPPGGEKGEEGERTRQNAPQPPEADNWTSGQSGPRAAGIGWETPDAFAQAVLHAGRVGLVVRSTGRDLLDGPLVIGLALPNGDERVFYLYGGEQLGPVTDVLGQVTVVGHDLKLGLIHLKRHLGIEPGAVVDTAIASQLLDGGRHLKNKDFFSFERLFGGKRVRKKIDWSLPLTPEEREDVAQEARDVLRFADVLQEKVTEAGLEEVAALEFQLLPIIVDMELAGVPVNGALWQCVVNMQAAEATALKQKLIAELGIKNVNNNDEILAALRRLGLSMERTNEEALAPYMHLPAVQSLTRYRPLSSFLTGVGAGVLRALEQSGDGRVHATLNQIGATTGRMSTEAPNLLGVPRDPLIRSCIKAPPGKKLIVGDYSTIDLRVLADQTGDAQLKRVFVENGDPHRNTAARVLNIPEGEVTEHQRDQAKPVNFGAALGMGPDTLIAHARKSYKVTLTRADAELFLRTFFETYPGVAEWQKQMSDEMPAVLRTKSGRRCCFFDPDDDYNARLAFPIQGTAADGMKLAMVLLHPHLKRLGARIILAVHDELLVEAPAEHAEEVRRIMRECMIAGMKKYVPSVPIVVEPEVRASWKKTERPVQAATPVPAASSTAAPSSTPSPSVPPGNSLDGGAPELPPHPPPPSPRRRGYGIGYHIPRVSREEADAELFKFMEGEVQALEARDRKLREAGATRRSGKP